jgi:hypothetical protein
MQCEVDLSEQNTKIGDIELDNVTAEEWTSFLGVQQSVVASNDLLAI